MKLERVVYDFSSPEDLFGRLLRSFDTVAVIEIVDPGSVVWNNQGVLPALKELLSNCLEQNANRVSVTIGEGLITIIDDVVHDKSKLPAILANIRRKRPRTTKKIGGSGIMTARSFLEGYLEAKLSYKATKDGRIETIITWPPLPMN